MGNYFSSRYSLVGKSSEVLIGRHFVPPHSKRVLKSFADIVIVGELPFSNYMVQQLPDPSDEKKTSPKSTISIRRVNLIPLITIDHEFVIQSIELSDLCLYPEYGKARAWKNLLDMYVYFVFIFVSTPPLD